MAGAPTQRASAGAGTHLVLYDGACGLCSRLVQFLLEHDRQAKFTFASLQSTAGRTIVERFGRDPDELASFHVLANYRNQPQMLLSRSLAALFVARELGWPWNMAGLMRVLPTSILDHAYNVVARNRYRVFGRAEQCLTPRPEFRDRFVE